MIDNIQIASAGQWESNMWQSHSQALLKMISRRRQVNHTEPHGFLVWVICLIDTYALLSGSGNGTFAQFILKNNMLAPGEVLPPLVPGHPQPFFNEELPYFPGVLELNHEVVRLALRVGETARDLRSERVPSQIGPAGEDLERSYRHMRQNRVREVQNLCRNLPVTWAAVYPQYWSLRPTAKSLPYRVRGFCGHVSI